MVEKTKDEIYDVLDKCLYSGNSGSNYPGMSYEDGVEYAIRWITGDSDEHPFED